MNNFYEKERLLKRASDPRKENETAPERRSTNGDAEKAGGAVSEHQSEQSSH